MNLVMQYLIGSVKSKTVWFNLLFLIVLIANQFGFNSFVPNETWVIGGNLLMRFMTTKSLLEK